MGNNKRPSLSRSRLAVILVLLATVASTLLEFPAILKPFSPSNTNDGSPVSSTAQHSTHRPHRSWQEIPDGCVSIPHRSGPMTTDTAYSIPKVLEDAFRLLDAHLDAQVPLSNNRQWKDVRPMSVAAIALQGLKVNFLWDVIQRWKQDHRVNCRTVCEVGLNAGHSSVLWLEACPDARAVLFDLPKNRYSQPAYDYLQTQRYASRVEAITLGNSLETIPQYIQEHPNFTCDLIAIDGSKDPSMRWQDFEHLKQVAHSDTLLLLDDASFDVMKAEYLSQNKNNLTEAMQEKLDLNALYSALALTGYLQLDGACATPGALSARQNASIAAHYLL